MENDNVAPKLARCCHLCSSQFLAHGNKCALHANLAKAIRRFATTVTHVIVRGEEARRRRRRRLGILIRASYFRRVLNFSQKEC